MRSSVATRTAASSNEDVSNDNAKAVPSDFERIEETKTKNKFIMVHKGQDRSKDRTVTMTIEDGEP